MSERNAKGRLEGWADRENNVSLTYTRESRRGEGAVWTVHLTLTERGAPESVEILAAAASIENACADAIKGLAEYDIDVP